MRRFYICLFKYTNIYINSLSLVISIIVFLIIDIAFIDNDLITKKSSFKAEFKTENIVEVSTNSSQKVENISEEPDELKTDWYLEIPIISLKANIEEGTTKEVMDNYIGHFEETSKNYGNVGLAAHNRGYKNNYFSRLKELKEGDEIIYKEEIFYKKYKIIKKIIIKDTNWDYLQPTEENYITLITCVENEPEYRRCVIGKEI